MSETETKFGVTPFAVGHGQVHEDEGAEKTEPAPAYTADMFDVHLDPPVQPRQDTYTVTLSEGVIVPTLGFSYPSVNSKPR